MKKLFFVFVLTSSVLQAFSQPIDTIVYRDNGKAIRMQIYDVGDTTYYYAKPRPFTFVTQIPKSFGGAAKIAFRKESLKPWGILAASTAILILADQDIADKVQQASRHIGLDNTRIYNEGISFNIGKQNFDIYEPPGNLNTAIYTLGEGVPSLLISAGLFGFGMIKKDNRAISTASQIVQATTAAGIMTQFFKRTTGRESPFRRSQAGGKWRPFPKPSVYQKNVPMYDAFPSGHMGTMVSTYVVLTENYPEKRWIRPVGIAVMSLVGLSMVNNEVHWTSDYPLAIGMGYAFGKATVRLNRFIRGEDLKRRK